MKNRSADFLITIGTISLLLCLLITVAQFCLLDIGYYERYFRLQETGRRIGTTQSNLVQGTESLLDYVSGKSDEIDIRLKIDGEKQSLLRSSEKEAMKSIQEFASKLRFIRNIAVLLAIAFFLFAWLSMKHEKLALLAQGYIRGLIIFVFSVAIISLLIAIDQLTIGLTHEVLSIFSAVSVFDSSKSIVARILPSSFWVDMVFRIGLIFMVVCGIILIASIVYLSYRSYRRRALLELKER